MRLRSALLAIGISTMASSVSAATVISVETFSVPDYLDLLGDVNVLASENFEGFTLVDEGPADSAPDAFQADVIETAVGDFSVSPGSLSGSGGTVTDPNPNLDGSQLAVRNGNVYGRTDSTADIFPLDLPRADQFLDSNDVSEMEWDVSVAGDLAFNTLFWVMSDATDVGALLTIVAGADEATFDLGPNLSNANKQIVKVTFDSFVTSASVVFDNSKRNDGLSIDDVVVGISPVPLPASLVFLGAGLAGLGVMGRKRRKS